MLNQVQQSLIETLMTRKSVIISKLLLQNRVEVAYTIYSSTNDVLRTFNLVSHFKAMVNRELLYVGFRQYQIDGFFVSYQHFSREYCFSGNDFSQYDVTSRLQ